MPKRSVLCSRNFLVWSLWERIRKRKQSLRGSPESASCFHWPVISASQATLSGFCCWANGIDLQSEKNLMMQLLAYLLKATSLNQNPFARLSFAIDPLPENLQCLHDAKILEIGRACYGSKLLLLIKMWVNHWKIEMLKLFPKVQNVPRFRYPRNFGFFFR